MKPEMIDQMIEALKLNEAIELDHIPNLELYIDQVITLFEEKLEHTKRNESDKLLTKTMINNYAKDKLLMPAKKKKYTREHIILMILLYEMKQVLTISDIKQLFSSLIQEDQVDSKKLVQLYQIYLKLREMEIRTFKQEVTVMNDNLEEKLKESGAEAYIQEVSSKETSGKENVSNEIEDLLMIIMLTQKANYYKRLAEKMIDEKMGIAPTNK